MDKPGSNRMKDAQATLDNAVSQAYGMAKASDPVAFLLELNLALSAMEKDGQSITGPGLPASVVKPDDFINSDCLRA